MMSIAQRIAEELTVAERQVAAAVELLDGGATVPFIARYRKEATGALDDTQLRALEERLRYLRELEERRKAILDSIRAQGKLDAALEAQINAADTKALLEDIYLPYKPKRRTKAQIARENCLEPLADGLFAHPERDPVEQAAAFVKPDAVATVEAALDGARAILVERFAEDADLREALAAAHVHGLAEPTIPAGTSVEDIRKQDIDPAELGARGYGHERLDQLVVELLLGTR